MGWVTELGQLPEGRYQVYRIRNASGNYPAVPVTPSFGVEDAP